MAEELTSAPIRGFLIALGVTLGLAFGFFIMPLLLYGFPLALFLPDSGVGGLLASILLMVAFSVACGIIARRRSAGMQFLGAFAALVVWCEAWWLVAHLTGVEPPSQRLRM